MKAAGKHNQNKNIYSDGVGSESMFGNLFKKKRTQDEIEAEITKAIKEIMANEKLGSRDFGKLLLLDKELTENKSFLPITNIACEEMLKKAEDCFFGNIDIQVILDYLSDISTMPNKGFGQYAQLWLTNKDLFEYKPQRLKSALDYDRDIQTQLDEIKADLEFYDKNFKKIIDMLYEAIGNYRKRDEFDKSDLFQIDERFSIMLNFMFVDLPRETVISARKALLSFALNYDMGEEVKNSYYMCKKYIYGNYINLVKKDGVVVPATDLLIAEGILQAYYADDVSGEEIDKNTELINNFADEFTEIPEMKEDMKLLVDVYKYLGLMGGK